MHKYEYDITSYSTEQVLARRSKMGYPPGAKEPVMYCDSEGVCFFDQMPNPNTQAIIEIFNEKGAEGWRLCSVTFRGNDMLCFWVRKMGKVG